MEGKVAENFGTLANKIQLMCRRHIECAQEQDDFGFYIPPSAAWLQHSADSFDLASAVNDFIESDKTVLLISGESGSGKSFFAQDYIMKKSQSYQAGDRIPLFISLPTLIHAKDNLMGEVLDSYGFTQEEIVCLQKTQRFLLVLDAYDETNSQINLYFSNKLQNWNVRLIITCRPSYFPAQDNYKSHFIPFKNNNPQQKSFQEVFVAPFLQPQVKKYIIQYLKVREEAIRKEMTERDDLSEEWLKSETYIAWINKIAGLIDLTSNPFLLRITMEVLPEVVVEFESLADAEQKFIMTKKKLYDKFVEQWFSRQEYKLIGLNQDVGEDFQKKCKDFAKELARKMDENNLSVVYYEDKSLFADDAPQPKEIEQWARFFSDKLIPFDRNNEALKELRIHIRRACPIKKIGRGQWSFFHDSLRDYFVFLSMDTPGMSRTQAQLVSRSPLKLSADHKSVGRFWIMNRFNRAEADELLRDEGIKVEFQPQCDTQKVILGRGHYGTFKVARNSENNRFAGVKKIVGDELIKQSEREAQCQRELHKLPNVMPLWDSQKVTNSKGQDVLLEFMPLAGFGNGQRLLESLRFCTDRPLKNKFIVYVFKSLLTGLKGMHNRRVVHLDMKLENFVMDCRGQIYIIDFGCAHREYDNINQILLKGGIGDSAYFSPDRLAFYRKRLLKGLNTAIKELADSYDAEKADIWATGLLMLQLYVERNDILYGYDGGLNWKLEHWDTPEIMRCLKSIEGWDIADENSILGVIKKLLSMDPAHRPSAVQLLQHPLFSDSNLLITDPELKILIKQLIEWKNLSSAPPAPNINNDNNRVPGKDARPNNLYGHAAMGSVGVPDSYHLYPKGYRYDDPELENIVSDEDSSSESLGPK